jgi:hypothetical protein
MTATPARYPMNRQEEPVGWVELHWRWVPALLSWSGLRLACWSR